MNHSIHGCQCQSVPSLGETLEQVKERVEFGCFPSGDCPAALDICKIITEIYLFSPGSKLRIDGELIDVEVVKQVYDELRHEHIEIVLENFKETTIVRNKKAYLRTALYNSYFEETVYWQSRVQADMVK